MRATSHVSALPHEQVRSHDGRVDARSEVVDVRDRDDADSQTTELVERPGQSRRLEQVAVPRRIQRRTPGPGEKELTRRLEPQRDELVEDQRVVEFALDDVCADRVVRGEARHQRDGHGAVQSVLERPGLDELGLEEAHPVDGGQHGLDHTAEPRGHASRENHLCDLAAGQSLDACRARLVVPRRARRGQDCDVVGRRRLDVTTDDVRLG